MTATKPHSVGRLQKIDTSDVVIRKLESLEHHYLSLLFDDANESLHSGRWLSAGCDSLGENTWCAGAFSGEIFVGIIRSQLIDISGVAETSLFVVEPWRRCGIAVTLLQATEPWARERGCSTLRIQCLRSNWSMRAFLERIGAHLDLVVGQIVAEISIDTLADEANGLVS